ncbi:putative jacalin-like lectin domain-containing protein [Helianthus annuus]|nr:putative jacalin-like lectin domain-containing protein [Helianthus annuus]
MAGLNPSLSLVYETFGLLVHFPCLNSQHTPVLYIAIPHSFSFICLFNRDGGSSGDSEGCITCGPWGGTEGHKWVYMPQPFTNKIKIRVRHGSAINSIELQSYCTEGEGQISIFGGQAGTLTDTICVDGTNEYLMSISGTRSCLFGTKTVVVDSICFMTNLNLYGPYGVSYGATFSHDVKDGVVVGFHGRASDYLNANWIYVMPKSLELDSNSKSKGKIMSELCSSMSRMVMPRDVGPRGAGGGQSWDDGVFSTIKQVRVHVGELNVIYALQFESEKRWYIRFVTNPWRNKWT